MIEVVEEVEESFDDFRILNNLGRTLYSREVVESRLSDYLLTQYLRHNQSTLLIADQINKMKDINTYLKYLFAFSMIKSFNLSPGRWVKSGRNTKEKDDIVLKLSIYFNSSPDITRKYMEVLTDEDIELILSRFDGVKLDKNNRLIDSGAKSSRKVKSKSTPTKKKSIL